MKILHVVGGYPTPDNPHCQVFIKTQVDSLVAAGLKCDVLVLQGHSFLKYLAGWPQIARKLVTDRFDLIHAHYAYCGLVALGHRLPVVVSLLGSDTRGIPRRDGTWSESSQRLHLGLCRYVIDHADGAIVKSQRMRAELARDVEVIPNGVDCDMFHPVTQQERRDLRRRLGLPLDEYIVIFAGNPQLPRKRFPLARDAVAQAAKLLDRPLRLVPVFGRPHSDVVAFMQTGDMLLLTSSYEGSPNVVKEAMAANMHVVAVDVGDTPERLSGVSGCRVSPDDRPEKVAETIADLITSGEPSCAREAIRELSMDKVAARIVDLYQSVLEHRRGRS